MDGTRASAKFDIYNYINLVDVFGFIKYIVGRFFSPRRVLPMTITRHIQDDLRARIHAGAEMPDRLTLAGISGFYKVSMMPVRLAVDALVRERLLRREENGRLAVNVSERSNTTAAASFNEPALPTAASFNEPALPTERFEVIAGDMVRLSLRGQSTSLRIADSAERYGISQSSMHTVFHRLAGAGILEHVPRRGWRVRPFRDEDLDAYLDVRELLELRALELAWPRLVTADLEDLLERNRPADADSSARLDNGLHRYWVDRSGNRYVQDFFDRHGAYYAVLYAHAVVGQKLIDTLAAQHRAILQPLLQRKLKQAQSALAFDIRSLRSILKEAIRRLEETPTSA
jgi:DNA-binding GntR family transcriptional regulator